jgi:YidC/Oxa1 family membrane protein insertase
MPIANVLQPLTDLEETILEHLHSIGLGWGLAIVGLTLMVRACTLPLTFKQFRAQRELKQHMPELKRMQQKYKQDKQRLQKETTAYYREHGINPLGAFAPILVQIPIFISLYYLMRTDVKSGLFGSDGFLWIPHLTAKPHGTVLVALMLTYLSSQLLSSAIATRTMQGGQRGLAFALPLLFVGVVARFPAGLAVYWITTSLWTLGQQLAFWRASRTAQPVGASATPAPAMAPASAGGGGPSTRARRPHPVSKKKKRKRRR